MAPIFAMQLASHLSTFCIGRHEGLPYMVYSKHLTLSHIVYVANAAGMLHRIPCSPTSFMLMVSMLPSAEQFTVVHPHVGMVESDVQPCQPWAAATASKLEKFEAKPSKAALRVPTWHMCHMFSPCAVAIQDTAKGHAG